MGNTIPNKSQVSTNLFPTSEISLTDLFAKINPQDKNFLKYVPDEFLNAEQIKAKREALEAEKRKYGISSRQSLKGSEGLSDEEVSEALADIDNEQNPPTNPPNNPPRRTAAQSVADFANRYIRNPLRWAYQRTVSGQAPLERLSKGQRALNGDQSITAEDLVQQVRGAGGIVDAVLEDGLFNIDGTRMEMGGERAPSWREMTARIPRGKEGDFNTYLQHRHNVDRVAQGTPLLAVSAEELY